MNINLTVNKGAGVAKGPERGLQEAVYMSVPSALPLFNNTKTLL